MEWYEIFKSDILTSYRVLKARIKAHPIMTIFFIFIAIAFSRITVSLGLFLDNMDMGEEPIYIERWVFSIIFFSFIFGKVALYTYRKVLKEREMLTLFSQPINMQQITIGKFLANIVYILALLLTGIALIYGWLIYSLGPIGIPLDILVEGVLLTLFALSIGYTMPIFLQLKPQSKRIINLGSTIILIGAVSIPLRFVARNALFFGILSIVTMIAFFQIFYASRFLLQAWSAQRSKPLGYLASDTRDRLLADTVGKPIITREAWLITKKELISLIREKDAIVTLVAAVFLTIASLGIYFYYGPEGVAASSMGKYLYPSILAAFLFLGTLMISALIGLAMISVEGRAFYIIKSMPVSNLDVLKGKSLALMIIGFPIIIPMSILLPVVANFPTMVIVFYIILAIVLMISFTGIGIWGGSRFPNFDPTTRNMPDLISQFFIMWICILDMILIGVLPAFLMTVNYLFGVVAILVALGWAITIFIWSLDRGEVGYNEIGADMYM